MERKKMELRKDWPKRVAACLISTALMAGIVFPANTISAQTGSTLSAMAAAQTGSLAGSEASSKTSSPVVTLASAQTISRAAEAASAKTAKAGEDIAMELAAENDNETAYDVFEATEEVLDVAETSVQQPLWVSSPVNLNSYDVSSITVSQEPNRLPLTGYFSYTLGSGRSVDIYIPERAPVASYFTVIEIPEDAAAADFIEATGWRAYADRMQEGLYILKPGEAGYGSYDAEKAYVEEAMTWLLSPSVKGMPVMSTYGIFYFAGYGRQSAAVEAWCARNPMRVIAQSYVGSRGVPAEEIEQIGRTPMIEEGRTKFVIEDDIKMTIAEITIPTYYVTEDASAIQSLDYWKRANDVVLEPVTNNGVSTYYQRLDSARWQTTMWNEIYAKYPTVFGEHGVSQVGVRTVSDGIDYAAYGSELWNFMNGYMSYDFSTEYNKQLSYRPDWDTIGVEVVTTEISPVKGHAKREYIVYAPDSCETAWGTYGAPLVLVEAGAGTTDRNFFNASQWWWTALLEDFIVVFLCEDNNTPTTLTYHDTDIFMDKVIDEVTARYKVDKTRIYLSGHSAGSGVSQAIGMLYPQRFAAVASTSSVPDVYNVAASYEGMFGGAGRKYGDASNQPIPVMFMYGEGDRPELHDGIWYKNHQDSEYYAPADEGKSIQALTEYHLNIWGLPMGAEGTASCAEYVYYSNTAEDRQHGYESWIWSAEALDGTRNGKVPVYQVSRMQNIGHTNNNTEFPLLWDFMKHYKVVGGLRYYSESGFTKDDKVLFLDASEDDALHDYVRRLYANFLGREADKLGLAEWVNVLTLGDCSASTLIKGFVLSREFQENPLDDAAYINALYLTILGREADKAGLEAWLNVLDQGFTRKKVLEGFTNSVEMGNVARQLGIEPGSYNSDELVDNNYNTTSFVSRLYWCCFNRRPDKAGLESWVRLLVSRRGTGSEVAWGFFNSPEFTGADWDDESYIYFLYYTMLDRLPDNTGLREWRAAMEKGVSRNEILMGFAGSVEFGQICERYGILR